MAPSTTLAIVHGVFAQLVFGLMAVLAATCSRAWELRATPKLVAPNAQTDYVFTAALLAALVAQLVLGALLRHRDLLVILHITNAAVVTLLALGAGVRAWGLRDASPQLRLTGIVVIAIVFVQLGLGVLALVARRPMAMNPTTTHALFTTLHQANGALLMAAAATLLAWTARLVQMPPPGDAGAGVSGDAI
jgi:heme A synthase